MQKAGKIVWALVLSIGIALTARWVRNNTELVLPTMGVGEAAQAAGGIVQGQEGFGEAVAAFSQSLLGETDGVVEVSVPTIVRGDNAD